MGWVADGSAGLRRESGGRVAIPPVCPRYLKRELVSGGGSASTLALGVTIDVPQTQGNVPSA